MNQLKDSENEIVTYEQYKEALSILKRYAEQIKEEYLDYAKYTKEVSQMDFSQRTINSLCLYFQKNYNEITIDDLWNFSLRNFRKQNKVGRKTVNEVERILKDHNIPFTDGENDYY